MAKPGGVEIAEFGLYMNVGDLMECIDETMVTLAYMGHTIRNNSIKTICKNNIDQSWCVSNNYRLVGEDYKYL